MKRNNIKVAIIDNSIDSFVYQPIRHWTSYLDVSCEAFKATEYHFPDLKNGYTHLILTGSEASILEMEKWVHQEIDLIHEGVKNGVSILGSCYGHQILAVALAGSSYVQRCTHPEIGWISIQITEDNGLLGKKRSVFSFSSHFDEVVDLGDEFLIFSTSEKCKIQAFQMKNKPIWGLQIHPEISITEGQKYLRNRVSQKLETNSLFEHALNSSPKDSGLIYQIIKNFLGLDYS